MRRIDIKAIISRHHKAFIALAVFVLAMLLGFSGGHRESQDADQVRLKDLYREMRRVLRILEPVLKPSAVSANKKQVAGVVQGLGGLIARGVISSLPDASWNEYATVTRGEALFYFARMLQVLEDDLVKAPLILDVVPQVEDIVAGHWLCEFLPKLAGIGALEPFQNGRLHPDLILKTAELRTIGSAFIDYLGSNLLILNFDGKVARLYPKGAMHELATDEWSYSFNRRDWYQIGNDGLVEPDFISVRACSIFFRHKSYREAGPIVVKANSRSVGMIKLQRNYSDFASRRLLAQNGDVKVDSEDEREKIRQRLAQIKERNQLKHASDPWLRPDGAEVESADETRSAPDSTAQPLVTIRRPFRPIADETTRDQEVCSTSNQLNSESLVTYQGKVIDALTSEPLKGAIILIESQQYTADSNGFFSFAAKPHAILDLTAYSEGFEALKIRHRAGYRAGPLTLSLKPVFASCRGTVTNLNSGNPVAKALVKIGIRATRTSADGSFALKGVRPGFHQLSVFARDYMEAHEIAHISSEPDQEINLRLRPMFSDDAVFADNYQGR